MRGVLDAVAITYDVCLCSRHMALEAVPLHHSTTSASAVGISHKKLCLCITLQPLPPRLYASTSPLRLLMTRPGALSYCFNFFLKAVPALTGDLGLMSRMSNGAMMRESLT